MKGVWKIEFKGDTDVGASVWRSCCVVARGINEALIKARAYAKRELVPRKFKISSAVLLEVLDA